MLDRPLLHRITNPLFFCFLFFLAVTTLSAQDKASDSSIAVESHTYKVANTSIVIPSPESDQVDLGSCAPDLMKIITPQTNRLVTAFVSSDDRRLLCNKNGNAVLSKYSLVEVSREVESTDFSKKDFKSLRKYMDRNLDSAVDASAKAMEAEINRKLGLQNSDSGSIVLDKSIQLGRIFSKADMYGSADIGSVTQNGKTDNVVSGTAVIRVRNHLLIAYTYATYRNIDSVKWVRKTTKQWATAILKANKR